MQNKRLFLLDIMPLLYRAHFATMGKQFGTTTGIDTRTTLVFFNYIFQVLAEEKPDAIVAALDSRPKQRVELSAEYKSNREKMPTEITAAFPYAMKLMQALKIPVIKKEGFEADDVIASLAVRGEAGGYLVYIVSPDKDFAQLVTDHIYLFRPAYKGAVMETLDSAGVKNKYGVLPAQTADFLALRGDTVDNITGIKGIGDKTAASLLAQYGTIEKLLAEGDSIKQQKVREAIKESKQQLLNNKQLALLTGDVPIELEWKDMVSQTADENILLPLLDELQFVKMKERLSRLGMIQAPAVNNDKAVDSAIPVAPLDLEVLLKKDLHDLAVGFLEQTPDRLFLMEAGDSTLYELVLSSDNAWVKVATFLDSAAIKKTGWQLKPLLRRMIGRGIILQSSWIDLSLAAYLLEPDAKVDWPYLRDKYQLETFAIVDGYSALSFLPSLHVAREMIIAQIEEKGLSRLLFDLELPLQNVISGMELHGINIDPAALDEIDRVLTSQLKQLEVKLYEQAGTQFNIGSPAQTAEILLTICDAGELKKTRTGQVSTAEPFLTDLAPKYPFVGDLLNYRKLNKIITTYVYSLPKYIHPESNRIHPTFSQIVAGTGRLSCTEPNLQNLPIRSEAGREVRKAIVPSGPGFCILSVDYNQVELRLLAALSGDKVMIETFRAGKDIHTTTASRVFDVDEGAVTKDMRSKAKGINFGIAYGITPWGLATRLKISQKEAKQIIDAYFEEFCSVKEYLEKSVEESRERGYTRTKYGRIRYIEGIDSRNGTTRKIAERMAVNAPLQGLAADIIKDAMIAVDRFILHKGFRSRLVLQVHDELVFDAANDELEILASEVVTIMETRGELPVPLKVEATVGKNWLEQEPFQTLPLQ